MASVIRRIAVAVADTDVAAVRWAVPLRAALVTTVVVGAMMALGNRQLLVPVAIGALFTGVGDFRGPAMSRAKGMSSIAAAITVACMLGALAADWPVARVAGTVVAAFACGYAGRAGPRSGVAGLLSLIVFVVFAGVPEAAGAVPVAGTAMLAGGAVQVLVGLMPQVVRRTGGVRADVCVAYRAVAYSVRSTRIRYGSVSPALKVQQARRSVAAMRADASVQAPLDRLLDALTRFRIGGLIVLSLPTDATPDQQALLDAFRRTAADLALAIGHAIEIPLRGAAVPRAAAAMEQAAAACAGIDDARMATGVGEMRDGLRDALAALAPGIPRGSMRSVPFDVMHAREPLSGLVGRTTLDDIMLRHAIRLALATGTGTLIAIAAGFPHNYWVPMTVAWVLRPDLAGTGVRVAARLAGTMAGLAVSLVVIGLFGGGPAPVLALVFLSCVLIYAFLVPNYSLCTAGVTILVIALFSYLGQPLVTDVSLRMLGTAVAAVLAMGVVFVVPSRTTEVIAIVLARTAQALGRYARAVREGADAAQIAHLRGDVAEARVTAGQVVEAAGQEAIAHRVHPDHAMAILTDMVQAAACVAVADVSHDPDAAGAVPERVVAECNDLARRLEARNADQPVPPRALPPAGPGDQLPVRLLDDAQHQLDLALAR